MKYKTPLNVNELKEAIKKGHAQVDNDGIWEDLRITHRITDGDLYYYRIRVEDGLSTPHKHAALIKQWADNPALTWEFKHPPSSRWYAVGGPPAWNTSMEYRLKPTPIPDTELLCFAYSGSVCPMSINPRAANIKLVFDGETGELKSVEKV